MKKKLLNEFYRELLRGVHLVGIALSDWQSDWTKHIINTINPQLELEFKDEAVKYLDEQKLYDVDENGNKADRAYSVLQKNEDGYRVLSYASFFKDQVGEVLKAFDEMLKNLNCIEDNQTNQKEEYITYFKALKEAFGELDQTKLIKRWQDVDRAWMKVTSQFK